MKNIKVILSFTAMAIIIMVVILNSCSKQELSDNTFPGNYDAIMSEEDISIQNKIVAFRGKLDYYKENPEFKSGEVMTSEEAIWNLETMFNVSYGFPDEQYATTKADNAVIIIDIDDNGEVSLDDVVIKYDEIINLVTQLYNSSGFESKGFLLLDLESGETINGQLEIELKAITGDKSESWEPFTEGEDWWYGNDAGKCDGTPFSDTTDAAELIEIALNSNKPLIYPPPGYRFIYIPDDLITKVGNEYPNPDNPDPLDNYTDYLIFYCSTDVGEITEIEECLEYDEMNFHFQGGEIIIYNILPEQLNKPSNWTFLNCNLEDIDDYDDLGNFRIRHKIEFYYGYRYLLPTVDPRLEL